MNLALERYAENPIIDELIAWPPRRQAIRRVRACSSMFRKPFIEVELDDGTQFHRHFQRENFAADWAETVVVLTALTGIELVSEFHFVPMRDADRLSKDVLTVRDECFAEAEPMFREGMYAQYLMQFGVDYARLPETVEAMLAEARRRLREPG